MPRTHVSDSAEIGMELVVLSKVCAAWLVGESGRSVQVLLERGEMVVDCGDSGTARKWLLKLRDALEAEE